LIYEYETYVEAKKHLPKKNKRVITPKGEGKVIDLMPLRDGVIVEVQDLGRIEFKLEELKPAEEYEAFVQKAENPSCAGSSNNGTACARCRQRQ
jgi:hypothetical protein